MRASETEYFFVTAITVIYKIYSEQKFLSILSRPSFIGHFAESGIVHGFCEMFAFKLPADCNFQEIFLRPDG